MTDPRQAVSPPVVTPALTRLRTHLDAFHRAPNGAAAGNAAVAVVAAAQSLLDALALRRYPAEPGTDDRGEQVVITVYGVDLSIRRRDDGVFVHVDSCDMAEGLLPLIGEFNFDGENVYAEPEHDAGILR